MQIQSQSPVTDPSQIAGSNSAQPPATPSIDGLATENTFLQLLIAQIKNQDPTNPTDSVQFLTQLAQFSQLEQLIGIRQELQQSGGSATSATDQNNGADSASQTTN